MKKVIGVHMHWFIHIWFLCDNWRSCCFSCPRWACNHNNSSLIHLYFPSQFEFITLFLPAQSSSSQTGFPWPWLPTNKRLAIQPLFTWTNSSKLSFKRFSNCLSVKLTIFAILSHFSLFKTWFWCNDSLTANTHERLVILLKNNQKDLHVLQALIGLINWLPIIESHFYLIHGSKHSLIISSR